MASAYLNRSRLLYFGRWGVGLLVLVILIHQISLEAIGLSLKQARHEFFLVALALLPLNICAQMWKWLYLLRMANPNVEGLTALKSLLVGYPLGFVTPGRLGEIGRAFYVPEINQSKVLRLVIFDKMTNLLITSILGFAALWLWFAPEHPLLGYGLAAAFVLGASAIGAAMLSNAVRSGIAKLLRIRTMRSHNLAMLMLQSLLFYGVYFTQFALLIKAHEPIALMRMAPAIPAVFVVKTYLPLAFGDLGIREGAAVFFLSDLGVAPAAALNAALLLFLCNIVIPTLVGLPIMLKTRREKDSLKRQTNLPTARIAEERHADELWN